MISQLRRVLLGREHAVRFKIATQLLQAVAHRVNCLLQLGLAGLQVGNAGLQVGNARLNLGHIRCQPLQQLVFTIEPLAETLERC